MTTIENLDLVEKALDYTYLRWVFCSNPPARLAIADELGRLMRRWNLLVDRVAAEGNADRLF